MKGEGEGERRREARTRPNAAQSSRRYAKHLILSLSSSLIIAIFLCIPSLSSILYLPIQRVTLDHITTAHSAILHLRSLILFSTPPTHPPCFILSFPSYNTHTHIHPSTLPLPHPSLIHSLTHSFIISSMILLLSLLAALFTIPM